MPNVFTYGSLMFDPVWSRVVAGTYDRLEAVLHGYDRKRIRDDVYPVIFPASPLSRVEGIVYQAVTATDLARLDSFEGEYYFRKTAQVVLADTFSLAAEVYVLKEEYYVIISPDSWDPVQFSTTDIHYFMHSYMAGEKQ